MRRISSLITCKKEGKMDKRYDAEAVAKRIERWEKARGIVAKINTTAPIGCLLRPILTPLEEALHDKVMRIKAWQMHLAFICALTTISQPLVVDGLIKRGEGEEC